MTAQNTPKVGPVLKEFDLDYLPEAHCYLRVHSNPIDVTTMNSSFSSIAQDVLEEQVIEPEQVTDYKIDYHQNYMKSWGVQFHPNKSFEELWSFREKCILALSN